MKSSSTKPTGSGESMLPAYDNLDGRAIVSMRLPAPQRPKQHQMTDYVGFYNNEPLSDGSCMEKWVRKLADETKLHTYEKLISSVAFHVCPLDVPKFRSRTLSQEFKERAFLFAKHGLQRLGIHISPEGQVVRGYALEPYLSVDSKYSSDDRGRAIEMAAQFAVVLFVIKAIRIACAVTNILLADSVELSAVGKAKPPPYIRLMLTVTPALQLYYQPSVSRAPYEEDGPPFNQLAAPQEVHWEFLGAKMGFCRHGLFLWGKESRCPILINLQNYTHACNGALNKS